MYGLDFVKIVDCSKIVDSEDCLMRFLYRFASKFGLNVITKVNGLI